MFPLARVFAKFGCQTNLFSRSLHCNYCFMKQTEPVLTCDNSQKKLNYYGQPTSLTHPHLIKDGELTPGIEISEYSERRDRLMQHITQNTLQQQHIAIIPSATKVYMTEKIPYVFRQNSDFLYLTGCLEPDSVLVMFGENAKNYKSILFLRKRDPHSELWDGPRTGVERAPTFFDVDQSLPISEFTMYLKSCLQSSSKLNLWYEDVDFVNPTIHNTITPLINKYEDQHICSSPRLMIHNLRLIKSRAEQELMQASCNIAAKAMTKAMSVTRPGITEHQLFATVDYECRMNGAEILAYPPVVATGNNATIIHYINNAQQTQSGEMILMDAGCEYHGYVSDITRTWPVDGKFTDPQRVLYEIILETQLQLIQECHKRPPLDNLFKYMCRLLGMKLRESGVLSQNVPPENIAKLGFDFCPHHVSHYLGMDVHDTAKVNRAIPLKEGMVVTVEPGIYISQNNRMARPEFRGIGIRIEDDVLITESGPVVLSANVPKEIDEIEKVMSSSQSV